MDTVFWNQPYMTAIIGGLSGSLITIIAMCFLDYRSEKRWLKAGYLKEQTEFNIKFAFDFANAMYAFSELCDLFFFRSSDKKALIEEKEKLCKQSLKKYLENRILNQENNG